MTNYTLPVSGDPIEAAQALDAHLALYLRARGVNRLEELGWTRPTKLMLHIPIVAGQEDRFLLEFIFTHYPEWPPRVRFVNPESKRFEYPGDMCWVPKIEQTQAIAIHETYEDGGQKFYGYICCSYNLDYYTSQHNMNQPYDHWNTKQRTFNATLSVIEDALAKRYQGRFRDIP